jgi:glycosyltransferase involved in cell wall biosynthesis
VIPTYNEIGNVVELLDRVHRALPRAAVLIVDDSSPDGTADAVERYASSTASSGADGAGGVSVLRRGTKDGLGAAYRAGFAAALASGAEFCVQMDADLSHDPAYLPELLAAVVMGADASIGSRYTPGGRIENWPSLRRFLSRWGNRFAAGMLGLAVNDATSGYRVYSRRTLEGMDYTTVGAEGYGFQVEMTHRAVRHGSRVVEIPILFVDRVRGESKLTHHIIGEAFGLVVRLWFRDRVMKRGYRS